jgi:serum/glucocorticoid-regulated kinase 2
MDICTGGELFYHLLQQRRFSEKLAKFYMCEILLGFKYMHEHDIVYRDIKPENILVDMDGHIRIADFGLSKIIPENERSHSFCGSPEYLSPEMLQNSEGHDRRLDIYCLGVLLYEMLTGLPPFYDEDHNMMFEKIMTEDLDLGQSYISKEIKHLLANMLEKDPVMRYQSIEEVMEHPWFSDVNWSQILNKTEKPPLQPDINSCYFENDNGDDEDDSP